MNEKPTDERLKAHREGQRDREPGGPLLSVRPLSPGLQQPRRRPAGQPPGHLERGRLAALGQQVHHQHQHRDELLAGRGLQPPGVPPAAVRHDQGPLGHRRQDGQDLLRLRRLGDPSQHRSLARDRAGRRGASTACGPSAAPGSASISGNTTPSPAIGSSSRNTTPSCRAPPSSCWTFWSRTRSTTGWSRRSRCRPSTAITTAKGSSSFLSPVADHGCRHHSRAVSALHRGQQDARRRRGVPRQARGGSDQASAVPDQQARAISRNGSRTGNRASGP